MKECNCYRKYPDGYKSASGNDGVCYGTRERDPCSCGGNLSKCDFYPEKRKGTCQFYIHGFSLESEEFHWCKKDKGEWSVATCECEGDTSKCTLDDSLRNDGCNANDLIEALKRHGKQPEELSINTAMMWVEAQETNAYYECINGDVAYSKELGLVDKNDHECVWKLENWDAEYGRSALDALLGECKWMRAEKPISIADAEKLLGRRIFVD